jgi:hypothetical protein
MQLKQTRIQDHTDTWKKQIWKTRSNYILDLFNSNVNQHDDDAICARQQYLENMSFLSEGLYGIVAPTLVIRGNTCLARNFASSESGLSTAWLKRSRKPGSLMRLVN